MRQLDSYKVLDYLAGHYEILHTQSCQWILEDIDEFIRLRKEKEVSENLSRKYRKSRKTGASEIESYA